MAHYRRYLYKKHKFKRIFGLYIPWKRFYKPLTQTDIIKLLNKYDLILPRVNNVPEYSIKEQYGLTHHIEDWNIIKDIIKEKYLDYLDTFIKVENGHVFYGCNMLIFYSKLKKDVISLIIQIIKSVSLVFFLKDYSLFGYCIIKKISKYMKQK